MTEAGYLTLQHGLDDLVSWSKKWQLTISLLPNLTSAKDLEVDIDDKLNFNAHVSIIAGRAQARAGLIHKCFISRNTKLSVRGFATYVRPILEYASGTWSPSTITNIKKVESVQKRFTKRLKGLHDVDYQNRLLAFGLDILDLRRLRADLTQTYKILFGPTDDDPNRCFDIFTTLPPLRGHIYRLRCNSKRRNTGLHVFISPSIHVLRSRVIAPWN